MARERGKLPGRIGVAPPSMLRKIREEEEFLSRRENLEKYPDQLVAIAGGVVWAQGPDHSTVVRLAKQALAESTAPNKPAPEDLVYVFVPDVVTPEEPLPQLREPGRPPGRIGVAPPSMLRKIREEEEFLSRRENLEKYPDQLVAIAGGVVWAQGPDHSTVVRLAKQALAESAAPNKPAPEDLVYVFVPDVVTPEEPLPQ